MSRNNSPKPTEQLAQTILLRWCLDQKNHQVATLNITTLYPWECDALSVTWANLAHEFEIKCSRTDFANDRRKVAKFRMLEHMSGTGSRSGNTAIRCPNYFWYVTFDDLIGADEIPPYAGLISIAADQVRADLKCARIVNSVSIRQPAQRLHVTPLSRKSLDSVGRIASIRLKKYLVKIGKEQLNR